MNQPPEPTPVPSENDPSTRGTPPRPTSGLTGGLFTRPAPPTRSFPIVPAGIATAAVLVILAALLLFGRKHGGSTGTANTLLPSAAYGPQLRFSGVELSESTSYSGAKSTFVDGHVTNAGSATVTAATLQLLFAPEGGGAPQLETAPLTLVRTRQPYVDIETVAAEPLAPGAGADFRLIFEDIRPEWNQQPPEIHVVAVTTR